MNAVLVLLLAGFALASAVPATTKQFRNLYVEPIKRLPQAPIPKIIGGQEATPHSIPYQCFLTGYEGSSGWYCGCSLISTRVVLTAGHCGDGATRAEIVLGAHRPQASEATQVLVTSTNVIVHESYNADAISDDIAIIVLSSAVTLNANIQTVPLPANDNNQYAGATARISGWGLTDGFGTTISPVLNYVDVRVLGNAECEATFGDYVRDTNICTSGQDDTGSCNGDSGGPLVVGGVQVGIVSYGVQYCLPGYPSAFTRTSKYLAWIRTNSP